MDSNSTSNEPEYGESLSSSDLGPVTEVVASIEVPSGGNTTPSLGHVPIVEETGEVYDAETEDDAPETPEGGRNSPEGRRFSILSDDDMIEEVAEMTVKEVGPCRIGYGMFPNSILRNGYDIDEYTTLDDGTPILQTIDRWIDNVQATDQLLAPRGLTFQDMPEPMLAPHSCFGIVHEAEELTFIMGLFMEQTGSDRLGIAIFPLSVAREETEEETGTEGNPAETEDDSETPASI